MGIIKRLLQNFSSITFGDEKFKVTFSAGAAEAPKHGEDFFELFEIKMSGIAT